MSALRKLSLMAGLCVIVLSAAGPVNAESIVVDGRTFASWTDFFRSDYFRENGKRCGTRDPFSKPGAPMQPLGGAGDCSLNLTNPLPEYEPRDGCEILVVVHRLESATGMGVYPDSLVRTQIDVLNEDFQALPGTNGAPGYNSRILFRLATRDPSGNPSPGWTRTTNEFWFNDLPDPLNGNYYDALAWDPNRYLNIYTMSPEAPGGVVLGYVPFLPQEGGVGSNEDGVRCLWNAFGRPSANAPYDLGRTVTHEVGHWLGLYHTFQDGCGTTAAPGCYSTGDRVCDTNPEAASEGGCPEGAASCGPPEPIHDYMDYTNDLCMYEFTHEQVLRMVCTMRYYRPSVCTLGGPTATLLQRFQGYVRNGGSVHLEWSALVDHDVIGWNVYRSLSEGEIVLVNAEPIPVGAGSDFAWSDSPGAEGVVSYRLAGVAADGSERMFGTTSVLLDGPVRAFSAAVLGENPSRGAVHFGYALPERGRVKVEVFTVAGQKVRTLEDGERGAGTHEGRFALRGQGDRVLSPGIYMIRIAAGAHSQTLRVVALE